jgi:DNA-binding transcriptional LysR family regulator
MTRVTLEQWRMLLAVVEHGGFMQAAEVIHKSQSSIHAAVSKLQSQLGLDLLAVEGRRVRLTEAGEIMVRRAQALLAGANDIEAMAQSVASGCEALIRLAVDVIFPQELLFDVLERFSAQFPHTRIELEETVLSGGAELLTSNDADIAVTGRVPPGMLAEPLLDVEFIAVTSPQHPLQQLRREIDESDLRNHRQAVLRDSARRERVDSGWLQADQRWTVSHISTSIEIVRRGLAFAWLARTRIEPLLQSGELKPLPLRAGVTRRVTLYLCEASPGIGTAGQALKQLLLQATQPPEMVARRA